MAGLVVTALGLWLTWQEHKREGDRFVALAAPGVADAVERLRDRLTRRQDATVQTNTLSLKATVPSPIVHATGTVLPPQTMDDRLAVLEAENAETLERLRLLEVSHRWAQESLQDGLARLEGDLLSARRDAQEAQRLTVLRGLPTAVSGLLLTVAGLGAQWWDLLV